MILGILLRSDELLLANRPGGDSWEFRRCSVSRDGSEDESEPGYMWDRVDEESQRAYLETEALVLTLPASICLVKRIKVAADSVEKIHGYEKWRVGIELPGNAGQFACGFTQPVRSSSSDGPGMIFSAVPAEYLRRLNRALLKENESRAVHFVPEYIGLAELAEKSAGACHQVALVHFENRGAIVVILRDGSFFKGRYFRIVEGSLDEILVDIEIFLLSFAGSDESLPLIVTGSAARLRMSWSPVMPAFLGEPDLDFSSVWGVTQFIAGGGRCELQAGR